MNIVVTGGAGFIGSALVRLILGTTDHWVLTLDRLSYASSRAALAEAEGYPGRHELVEVDIRRRDEVSALLERFQPDLVFHLAAETHVDRSIDDPAPFVAHNVTGTMELLEALRGYWRGLPDGRRDRFRVVHVSTDEVFGALDAHQPPFSTSTAYAPRSPYAASKAASDHLARAWHETYGLPVMVTNCSNNYGPFQFPEKLIPLVIIRALEGQTLPIYGTGANVRDWIHVDDHARALLAAGMSGQPGQTYLIGADGERSNLQVVQAICGILDELVPRSAGTSYGDLITFVADRPGHDFRYAIDSASTRDSLNWAPRVDFEQGLRQTVRWYLDHADWWRPILANAYDGRRLGRVS